MGDNDRRLTLWQGLLIAVASATITAVGAIVVAVITSNSSDLAAARLIIAATQTAEARLISIEFTPTVMAEVKQPAVVALPGPQEPPSPTAFPTSIPALSTTTTAFPTSIPVPSTTLVSRIIFADDFDAGPSAEWDQQIGTWRMVNGEYSITNIVGWTNGISLIGDPSLTDYRIEVEIDLQGSIPNNHPAIVVRLQDMDNYLVLKLTGDLFGPLGLQSTSKDASWYIVEDGEWTKVGNAGFNGFPTGRPFVIEVHVRQDIVSTYLDGQRVSSWSNAPYLNGRVGLSIDSNTNNTVTFDNFVLESLSQQ